MTERLSKKSIFEILELAKTLHKPQENAKPTVFSKRIKPIVGDSYLKFFLIRLLDTSFRSSDKRRISNYIFYLFKKLKKNQKLFNQTEKVLIYLFKSIGYRIPFISIPLFDKKIKQITNTILFFVGGFKFEKHALKRKSENVRLNVNLIGEALIGEEEAALRIQNYIHLLHEKNITYISLKISTIYSQIKPLDFENTVSKLVEKLSILYREVLKIIAQTGQNKFVNLDMEEYQDLELTVAAFMKALDRPEFKNLYAGIVLQAYLPDTFIILLKLQTWALKRVENGGAPIKIRIVKGANLEMEKTTASLESWQTTPYSSKIETDANFKKLLVQVLDKKSSPALHIGIASHNIFDLAFALYLVKKEQIEEYTDFEMLEGMANETVKILLKKKVKLLLYTPIVKKENYNSAIAYLVRRLDEVTQDGNFLKEGFDLKIESAEWKTLEQHFLKSIATIETLRISPNRTQNRATETHTLQNSFSNVPNTDWTLLANRQWIDTVKKRWEKPLKILGNTIPIVGIFEKEKRKTFILEGWSGNYAWNYELAEEQDYNAFLDSDSEWYEYDIEKRAFLLKKIAVEISKNRGDLIGVAVTELGKTITETDVEISEAIDFANYYAENLRTLSKEIEIDETKKGVHLVLSPWNFPLSIPVGGVLASLAAGKRVILKPSQNAIASAYLISKCFWECGVPKSAFAFLPTEESTLDPFLTDPTIFDAIILTGATDTAQFLLNRTPTLKLFAETGGKNATIVSALSDREQAISNSIASAFGASGQKCSSTSLLILEKEVYEDAHFKNLLKDCAESKTVGNPWEYGTDIGPLGLKVSEKLKKTLKITPPEKWLLKPVLKGEFILSPGIIWGVTSDDFVYKNELFGPILAVMKSENLEEAIHLVNKNKFGLTSGIESLDKNEVSFWKKRIKAGNIYANRTTTGAIVQRQPFGGMKASSFGFGMKAGGTNYLLQFLSTKPQNNSFGEVKKNYANAYTNIFSKATDNSKIRGQHNTNVYLKASEIIVCLDSFVGETAIRRVKAVAEILQIPILFYALEKNKNVKNLILLKSWAALYPKINHNTIVRALNYDRIEPDFLRFCHTIYVHVYGVNPNDYGRIELLSYFTEQNQSINYHRYGNLMGVSV